MSLSPVPSTKTEPDYLGYVLFSVPPTVAAFCLLGVPLNQFVLIPIFLASSVFTDAARWKLPRWLWLALMALLWPVALPGYGFIRRFHGASAHWSLGILSIAVWFGLTVLMFAVGRGP